MASAYAARPPYPEEVFDILESLLHESLTPGQLRRVLELGCGTGDLTLELANRVDWLDAVDFSEVMLAVARSRPGAQRSTLRWHNLPAESFVFAHRYNLIVAGASPHWMDWPLLFPRLTAFLNQEGILALVDRSIVKRPWEKDLKELIPQYSTNREFKPYDLIAELKSRELFDEHGRRETRPIPFSQPLDAYVESFQSANGFSHRRMDPASAADFDTQIREITAPFCPDGIVRGEVGATVIWGKPRA